jgi:hypothetical protein
MFRRKWFLRKNMKIGGDLDNTRKAENSLELFGLKKRKKELGM